jgi:hypothetical protein
MNDAQLLSLTSLLLPFVVSFAYSLYGKLPLSTKQKLTHIKNTVGDVVQSVEQACSTMSGPDKKAEATRVIVGLLGEVKIHPNPLLVQTLIEQAVYTLNQQKQATVRLPRVVPK